MLDFKQNEKHITFWTSEGLQQIPIGFNTMLKGDMMRGMEKIVTATSGAWTNNYTYQMTMYNYETPHATTYNFRFEGDELMVHSAFNVNFGPKEQPQMTGKME
jgi:hypothetical protein